MARTLCLIVALLLSASPAFAQAERESPYRKPNLLVDGTLLAAGLGLGVSNLLLGGRFEGLSQAEVDALNRDDVNAFDRGAIGHYSKFASDIGIPLGFGLILSPPLLLFSRRIRKDWGRYLLMYAEVFLIVNGLVDNTKQLVGRPRPYMYDPDVPLEGRSELEFDDKTAVEGRKSFFSSDVSNGFAFATMMSTVISDYYPRSVGSYVMWAGTLTLGVAVGVGRFYAGGHFPTDILTGAAVGSLVGLGVPWLHRLGVRVSANVSDDGTIVMLGF